MLIMRTLIWFLYFWLFLIFSIPLLFTVRLMEKRNQIYEKDVLVNKIATIWAKSLINLTGSRVKVTGTELIPTDGPVLFVSNHQGNFDIPLLLAAISKPKGFVAKIELKKMPLVNRWMQAINCVFIKRNHPKEALKSINEGIAVLRKGYSLVVFPEGTRSKGKNMNEFKSASLRLATKSGVPIVPITINGSYKIMEQNSGLIRPADVEITISEPINPQDFKSYDANELMHMLKTKIEENLR
ncbi:lysophospholipid acyltransferase family protein [Desulfonispora thiosulfatigenes]|nr:lysophospholipid acyltransferase family protein [Desulfonispora thiosulfatigenes]